MYERGIKVRIAIITLGLLLVFTALGVKLAYLQLSDHSKVTGREYKREITALRGSIYARMGREYPMAVSLPAKQFYIDPKSVKPQHDITEISRVVAEKLQLPRDEVLAKFNRTDSRYIKLGISLDDEVFRALATNTISGIGAEDITIRRYPQGRRMAHVLGFVNNMGVGGAGLEQQYNRYLCGTPGLIEGEKDAGRMELFNRRRVQIPPIAGADLYLTLDHNIQAEVEQALQECVESFDALAGWSIVQLVKTGEILAMASYPDFEPQNYTASTMDIWRNNALAIVYEPGSVMKIVTVAAALNERIVTPATMFEVYNGSWAYGGRILRDHVYGRVNVATALKKSSNIACAKIGLSLGNRRMEAYMRGFNFGIPLGIELPGEERGIIENGKEWERDKLKITRVAIGQGVAVTAIQMISAISAIANDGKMMQPYLVDRVVSPSGEELLKNRPRMLGRPIRAEVSKQMLEMLSSITEEGGTGKRAQVAGYSVAGKTGTAQKAIPMGYSSTDYYASFIGVVPAHDPVFAVLVSIDRPRPQHTGGFVAAPVFSRIGTYTARYLELEPDLPQED